MSEDKKEFKQAYLEEKLQAIADKLGDAYGEPFLSELISRMERTVAHFNEQVDIMLSSVKANTKERQKHFQFPKETIYLQRLAREIVLIKNLILKTLIEKKVNLKLQMRKMKLKRKNSLYLNVKRKNKLIFNKLLVLHPFKITT